jgi:PAS domain S-box-containing protein
MSKQGDGAEKTLLSGEQAEVPPLSMSSQIGYFVKWKRATRPTALLHETGFLLLGLASLAAVTGLYFWLDVPLVAAAFTYLIVLVLLSLISNFSSLIALSFIGVCCLSYFFAPPIYSFRVDYSQDLITISAFVITSFVVNFLVTRARTEQRGHLKTCESLRDVNRRLDATNEALLESEYKLRQIIETVPTHLWSADPNFEPTRLNRRLLDYFGRRFEEFKHGGWEAFIHPDDLAETAKAVSQAVQTGTYFQVVHRLRRADGEYRWHHARGEPLRDRQGNILQWYGLSVDIDERKKAGDLLRRSEAYLAEAQRLSRTGTWVLNPTTMQYLYWSDESYRIWAFDPLQGFPSRDALWQRIHPDDRDGVWEEVQEALRQKRDYSGEFRIVLPNGPVKYLAATSRHLFSTNGELVEVIGTNVDVTERKRADEALRESEYKLRQIVETVPGLLWSAAPDGAPTHFNQRLLDYFGMPFENHGRGTFIHPDDLPAHERAYSHAIQTGTSYQCGYRLRRADGEYRWHEVRGEPLRDQQGRIIQWYGLSVDVDEAKTAEDRLRRSEAHLAEAQRLSHTGSAVYNDTTILYWSDETYRIFGFDPRNGLPSRETALLAIHPDDRERVQEEARQGGRQKRDYRLEYRLVLPATIKYIEGFAHPKFSASGELMEVVSTIMDVTERKRAEQALRESEAKFRDYAETASDWFWETGPDHKFTLLTENAFGSRATDRIGTACWDHALDLETEPEKWRLVRATLDSRKPFRDFVYRVLDGHGSPMHVKASGKAVFDADGEFRGYRGTGTDVTALIRAQEEHERLRQLESDLAHMNRLSMMGELAASLAHEIAQPVATARNNARAAMHFLDRSPPDPAQVKEALTCLVDDADRAGEILDRIRDHIKKAPPRKERVDLNQAITDVIALAQGAIVKNGVSIQTRLTEGLSDVRADCVQLQQVVLNLILNAVEAMGSIEERARELSITTEQHEAGGVLVTVRDSGPGIDSENLDRVFDAFYTTKASGVGMGLSICRSIIHAHGGRLWADVNSPRGAAFRFTLSGADKELTNSFRPARLARGPHEDTVSDAAHQPAYEDYK